MCGRIDLSENPQLDLLFDDLDLPHPPPAHNVAPTDTVPVIVDRGGLALCPMRWWLTPFWADAPVFKYSMFNARAETLATNRAFRGAFQSRRCLVPVAGFYEWLTEGKHKQPYLVRTIDSPMLLAGIWDVWERGGDRLESFAIVTVDAAPGLAWLHHRQPALIHPTDLHRWLDPRTPPDILHDLLLPGLPSALEAVPVSPEMGNARYKGEACVEPIAATRPIPADPSTPAAA